MTSSPPPASVSSSEDVGDFGLLLSSGSSIDVFSLILQLASPVLKAMMAEPKVKGQLQVEGSKEAWELLLPHLYHQYPRPELTLSSAAIMLPLAHKYSMLSIVAEINTFLLQQFPAQFSFDPTNPGNVFEWLDSAIIFQLDELRKMCATKIKSMMLDQDPQLEQALVASIRKEQRAVKRTQPTAEKPSKCGSGHYYCAAWCDICKRWVCSNLQRCPSCSPCQPVWTPHTHPYFKSAGKYRWFASDEPKLQDSIKALSRGTLEELLASMTVVKSGSYSKYKPAA